MPDQICAGHVADLSDSILIPSGNGQAEAESILKKGLDHVAIMRKQDPSSAQARQVDAFLHFCLAQSTLALAGSTMRLAASSREYAEMESLCVEFPWNRRYWELARYFQRDTARVLQSANGRKPRPNRLSEWSIGGKRSALCSPMIRFPKPRCRTAGRN